MSNISPYLKPLSLALIRSVFDTFCSFLIFNNQLYSSKIFLVFLFLIYFYFVFSLLPSRGEFYFDKKFGSANCLVRCVSHCNMTIIWYSPVSVRTLVTTQPSKCTNISGNCEFCDPCVLKDNLPYLTYLLNSRQSAGHRR